MDAGGGGWPVSAGEGRAAGDDDIAGVPSSVVVSLSTDARRQLALLARWLRTDRYAEVLRMGMRAAARHLEAARTRGEEPVAPAVPLEMRGRPRGGSRTADRVADAVRQVSPMRRLSAAMDAWNAHMLEAGVAPTAEGAEAERWREAWRAVELVVMARARRRDMVRAPAGSVSPQRHRQRSAEG